ncbi:MAG: nuclear transport factor 2 family protein [Calditrichaeota bacterium]|nr:MAG: nuclear transport factor 2 family protein [Calditrichota bacterium]
MRSEKNTDTEKESIMKSFIKGPILLVAAAFLLSGCARQEQGNSTADREAISLQNQRFARAYSQGDAATLAGLYTQDAYALAPGNRVWEGRQAIRDGIQKELSAGQMQLQVQTVSLTLLDDHAYEVGTYTIRVEPEGSEAFTDHGKYLTVWQKQADGSWLIRADAYNSSTPRTATM